MGPRASALEFGGLPLVLLLPFAGMAGVAIAVPPTGAVIFGVAGVAAAAGVAAVVDTTDFDLPGGGRWCRGIAFHYSPGSGSRFCRWRLARCG